MNRKTGMIIAFVMVAISLSASAQSDLAAFPIGTTTMVYEVVSEGIGQPQTLTLVVTVHGDDLYTVSMTTEATGTEDELAAGFGFIFGAASVSSGGGRDVNYSSIQALIDQRNRLQAGADYALPGADFVDVVAVTIAGVDSLEGTIVDSENPDSRTTIAFALTDPVYISPRIVVEELRDGEWVETFRMELVGYGYEAGED